MSGALKRETLAIGLAAIALSLLTIVGLPGPLQAVAALAILILLPGLALARLLPVTGPAPAALLALALGLATLTAVSLGMFYLAVWSWQACVLAMGLLTVLATVACAWQDMARTRKEVAQ
ncbi:hypothetical protein ACLH0K_17675 [Arthrobacter sp. MPF02]|uniref:hypothetical protein n=1 Tax=Arthrobacter sp. MPF02 TaxID=3388492 RepID=UPI003984F5EF